MTLPHKTHDQRLPERIHLDASRSVFLRAGAAGRTGMLFPTYARPQFLSGRVTGKQARSLVPPAFKKSGGMRHGATAKIH